MAASNDKRYAIGIDYGTNSARAVLVDLASGQELATHIHDYPSGDAGVLTDPKDPHLARQNPADYIEGFIETVRNVVQQGQSDHGLDPGQVAGLGVDTTGSTPIPVDESGTPLAMHDQFKNNLAAHAWLWKDHTSADEADEITQKARDQRPQFLNKCGEVYSSEWYWSKILHCKRVAPEVFDAAYSWVELADFVPAYITGQLKPEQVPRSVCAAGHKAMYHEDWGGLPDADFLASLDPALARLREPYKTPALSADKQAGTLTGKVAEQVGLAAGTPVAVGAFDAHMGAVGAGVSEGTLVKIIGTSTCDIMVAPLDDQIPDIPGLCGIVPESVLPGYFGLEAGQSAVGDIFNWFVQNLTPGAYAQNGDAHAALTEEAKKLKPGESGLLSLDWHNGNRTILVDPLLSGLMVGQTLHTTAPEMYRALIEATAFGALTIINRLADYGVEVREVVNCGGIAEKNPFVMQTYADVCNRPMKISRSSQTPALGAAIFGAVAGGAYDSVGAAQKEMTGVKDTVYHPDPDAAAVYGELYPLYRQLHDALGTGQFEGNLRDVMKQLARIRQKQRGG
jgi:L-ribulokinase